jgi:hypothetical protein
MHFYCASSLKQQSESRHVATLVHIILSSSQLVIPLTSVEAANNIFIVFCFTRPAIESMIHRIRCEHANITPPYTTDVILNEDDTGRNQYN